MDTGRVRDFFLLFILFFLLFLARALALALALILILWALFSLLAVTKLQTVDSSSSMPSSLELLEEGDEVEVRSFAVLMVKLWATADNEKGGEGVVVRLLW